MKTERQRQIDRLDDLWSELIRKRAMYLVHGCQAKPILNLPICTGYRQSWLHLQAAHCFSRGRETTKWDPRNGAGVCGYCHQYIDTHEDAKFELFRALIGNSYQFEELYIIAHLTIKQYPINLDETAIHLKNLIRELDGVVVITY